MEEAELDSPNSIICSLGWRYSYPRYLSSEMDPAQPSAPSDGNTCICLWEEAMMAPKSDSHRRRKVASVAWVSAVLGVCL